MTSERSKPAPLFTADTGFGNVISSAARDIPGNTKALHEFQAAFIAGRYGVGATHAHLVTQLAWSRE